MSSTLYGAIEFGGTKTICAIGSADGKIAAKMTTPTLSVDETLENVVNFFTDNVPVASLGVGSFGPLQLNSSLPEFGYIKNSPKPGWENVNIKELLETKLKFPVILDTDVNCAALGEKCFGVAKNVGNFIYLTLGTGIGGGLMIEGKVMRGVLNLEMGHMRIPHEEFASEFQGSCPFHGDCLEGIASGRAMELRYGQKPEHINNAEAWDKEAEYLASALNNLIMTTGPELIVLGGGLTNHPELLPAVRTKVFKNINGYMEFPDMESYILESSGNLNGVHGAIKLASISEL